MKSFGGIPNEEDLIPLIESHKNDIVAALAETRGELQSGSSELQKEVIEVVNYILEQSTVHKQEVEGEIKNSRRINAILNESVERLFAANQEAFKTIIERIDTSTRNLTFLWLGSLLLNFGTAVALIYMVLTK